jgi:tripartite-type tricarboxylate transporter receptor subunit TctC
MLTRRKTLRVIVPYPAGGGSDIYTRHISSWLSDRLGQQFVVENRPGASGNIGTEVVTRAAPDGYTLLSVNSANAINATLFERTNFNFLRDIAPVGSLVSEPVILVVNPKLPTKTFREFVAYTRSNAGKVNYASPGTGAALHLFAELLKQSAGIDMVHVPYRGMAPALSDVIGGQVQAAFSGFTVALEHLKAGTLRPLGMGAKRTEVLPDLPAIAEFVPGFDVALWFGVGAPKSTPAPIVERLNSEINAGLADARLKARMTETGSSVLSLSVADFGRHMSNETEKWAKVIRAANIKPE